MSINENVFHDIFNENILTDLFPSDRADQFFEALFGDPTEGAYDISLSFKGFEENKLRFDLLLNQRPGKCLACNLTYGLPGVFSRHPIINVKGIVEGINQLLNGEAKCEDWELGRTREITREQHAVPLTISLAHRYQ